jgi:predicted signal transduction protein with EAL and GGDEF domain
LARIGWRRIHDHLPQLRSARGPEVVAGAGLQSPWRHPFSRRRNEHFLNASIGIAFIRQTELRQTSCCAMPDTAMYRAKDSGRGCYVYFEERMNVAARARVSLERELRRAIDHGEFTLCYQPKLDLRSGRISGAERCLRWDSPDQAPRAPMEFIPLAKKPA